MDMIKKECRKRIYRSLGTFILLLFIVFVLFVTFYANSIISLFQGESEFSLHEEVMVNKENENNFDSLQNEYTKVEVKTIIGSYAEYGSKVVDGLKKECVYYLMPIQNGSYFITIIANEEDISKFDELEQIFYKNLGEENKLYADGFEVSGGFVSLSDEEKAYALEFFEGYDENVKDITQLSQIVSPYAIRIGEIGNTSITTLWFLFIIIILLLLVIIIGCFIIYKDILLKQMIKNMEALSENDKEIIEEDFKQANILHNVRFGKKFLYRKTTFAYEFIPYDNQIWMYKEHSMKQRVITYQIQVYDKAGKADILYQNRDEKIVDEVLGKFFDLCSHAVLGYQFSLHVTAMDNPEKLYKKVKDLLLIENDKTEEEVIVEEEVKKEEIKVSKRKRTRKTIDKEEETIPHKEK